VLLSMGIAQMNSYVQSKSTDRGHISIHCQINSLLSTWKLYYRIMLHAAKQEAVRWLCCVEMDLNAPSFVMLVPALFSFKVTKNISNS